MFLCLSLIFSILCYVLCICVYMYMCMCVCWYIGSIYYLYRRQPGFIKLCDDDPSIGFALSEAIAKKINKGMNLDQAKSETFDEIKIKQPSMQSNSNAIFTTAQNMNRFGKRNSNVNVPNKVAKKRKAPTMMPEMVVHMVDDNNNNTGGLPLKKKRKTS